jgi:dolichol-phosphate mannosyltransferase
MSLPRSLALVVPTFNESGNIKALLERAVTALENSPVPWEIIIVDDESTDGTSDIVRQNTQDDPRVRLLMRPGQRGLAGAIIYGWTCTDADLLGVIDADLQHPPELLPVLVNEVYSGYDIAIASRYVRAHSMDDWSPVRRLISRISCAMSKAAQKPTLKVADPMSGFFVVRRECVEGLRFQPTGFKLLLEILVKGRVRTVKELPFRFEPRQRGRSKANAMTVVHYLYLLSRLVFKRSSGEPKASCS